MYKNAFSLLWRRIYACRLALLWLGIIAGTLFLVLYNAQLSALFNGTFIYFGRASILNLTTPGLSDFIMPNAYLSFLFVSFAHSTTDFSVEKVVFFGYLELLLFVFFFFSSYSKRFKLFIFLCSLFPFLLSLGYGQADHLAWLPYHFLQNIFPFKGIAEAGRFSVITFFFMTIAIVLGLVQVEKKSYGKAAVMLVVCLLILERISSQFVLSPSLKTDKYITIVKSLPTKAVLDIPVNQFYSPYDMLSFYYDKPIVNGYFHWAADGPAEQSFLTQDSLLSLYSCSSLDPILTSSTEQAAQFDINQKILSLLKTNGITTIVVHKDDKFYHPVCKNVRERLSALIPHTTELEDTTTSGQQQVQETLIESHPAFTLYVPTSGTLYLDGVYIAPSTNASFSARLNGTALPLEWQPGDDPYSLLLPSSTSRRLSVTAGSRITFSSNTFVQSTPYSVWYRFVPDGKSPTLPLLTPLHKAYEDSQAAVYTVQ